MPIEITHECVFEKCSERSLDNHAYYSTSAFFAVGSLFFHVVPVKLILSSWSLLYILVCRILLETSSKWLIATHHLQRCEKETVLFPILTTVPILGECPKTYWGTIVNNRLRMMCISGTLLTLCPYEVQIKLEYVTQISSTEKIFRLQRLPVLSFCVGTKRYILGSGCDTITNFSSG
ncbi:uncharacterized protein LOC133710068 isoform X2 [Rosa rugosa]|uniref:uncharacterized protein LOC133710068 isoform X2 n=1 Tax=Rosa rugosa TaxID=74645 RepID=UPI002B405BDF|nr:uncharacterized protein LOC133710068 isoform X2 [Rosa rugosa]